MFMEGSHEEEHTRFTYIMHALKIIGNDYFVCFFQILIPLENIQSIKG